MAQYQTFPDAHGDSRTLDKLKALRLPDLAGRSFMDVGCNEGFFCGFAKFAGATRVVGLDQSRAAIERARARFPDCEFHCQSWDELPDGPFDVILLASALHYAEDQPALLHRLVDRLGRDGVLVLELGLVASKTSEWVKVQRGIDERWFPSLSKLREIVEPHVSKWQGPSIAQAGDPVPRHVIHVSRRRPVAWLLMKPPGHGKSSLARKLFVPAGIPIVSGDKQMVRLARGEVEVSAPLRDCVAQDFSRLTIDATTDRVFAQGLGRGLVAAWLDAAGPGDFALDGYVPSGAQDQVRQYLMEAGYLPVVLDWNRPGPPLLDDDKLGRKAKAFYGSLRKRGAPAAPESPQVPDKGSAKGFVDRLKLVDGRLIIGGWAVNAHGKLPDVLAIRLKDRIVTCADFEVVPRPDVAKHLDALDGRVGFRIDMDADGAKRPADLGAAFSVAPAGGRPLRFTGAVAKLLGRKEK